MDLDSFSTSPHSHVHVTELLFVVDGVHSQVRLTLSSPHCKDGCAGILILLILARMTPLLVTFLLV